jgi:plasmid maintenance system antidote protein VapI
MFDKILLLHRYFFPMKAINLSLASLPSRAAHRTTPDPALLLGKATSRTASLLGLNGAALARTIGLSEPTVSRILHGQRGVEPASKEGELAALLVRVYRSLDALVGNDDGKRAAWMNSHNAGLGGVPKELIQTVQGLVGTLSYLDGMRAPA